MPKKRKKTSSLLRVIITGILVIVLYLVFVWFFPILDITRGINKHYQKGFINTQFDNIATVLGVERKVIVALPKTVPIIEDSEPILLDEVKDKEGQSASTYRVYFSTLFNGDVSRAKSYNNSIDRILSKYLKNAKQEINLAIQDFESEKVASALIYAKKNGIDVKMVVEEKYKDRPAIKSCIKAGIPVQFDTNPSLMHNKFIIIDDAFLWTGSYNITDRGSYYNDNNVVVFSSTTLAKYYNDEFDEMFYEGLFGVRSPDYEIPLRTVIIDDLKSGKIEVTPHFSPDTTITDKVVDAINSSKESIYFAVFSFTKDEIGEALIKKHNEEGIEVIGVFESQQISIYSEYDRLKKEGLRVFEDANKYNLHHKFFIVDKEIVITGSANFSNNAEKRNDENLLVIKNKDIAERYYKEFLRVSKPFIVK